jgi:hypothetical protein
MGGHRTVIAGVDHRVAPCVIGEVVPRHDYAGTLGDNPPRLLAAPSLVPLNWAY